MVLSYRALWSYICYTLYFIARIHPTLSASVSLPSPSTLALHLLASCSRFLLSARRGCMQNARDARFSESVQSKRYYAVGVLALLPTWPRLFRLGHTRPPFHAFSPFFSLSFHCRRATVPLVFLFLPFSTARPFHPLLSSPRPAIPASRRRNIFPEHYFYRSAAVRTCARSAILSAN